jgi:hypothetical protein
MLREENLRQLFNEPMKAHIQYAIRRSDLPDTKPISEWTDEDLGLIHGIGIKSLAEFRKFFPLPGTPAYHFQKAKQLIIEGFDQLYGQCQPYFKIAEGMRLMGIIDIWPDLKKGNVTIIKMQVATSMQALRNATTADEITKAIKENGQWFQTIDNGGIVL